MAEKAAPEQQSERREVTIKFGKGLVEPFVSKSGKELARINIPNRSETDKRPWESFVVPTNYVHDNKFGKGVWMKLPEDGTTKLTRPVLVGQYEAGKNCWRTESRQVSNAELKSLLEAYKEQKRDSVLSSLSEKKAEAADRPRATKSASRSKEASL